MHCSGGMMTVAAEIVPREHSMPELAEASRSRQPVLLEPLEDVVRQDSFDLPLDEPDDFHDLLLLRPTLSPGGDADGRLIRRGTGRRSSSVRLAPRSCYWKEKGAGVNASPSLITLDSVAQALPM
jgi:hypothetical protein